MSVSFVILGLLTLAAATAAVSLRNLVHCALSLAVAFAGFAALYLQLDAQFVGFAQVLVYIGAVTILIVFAILLTRGSDPQTQPLFSSKWLLGAGLALAVFAVLAGIILGTRALPTGIAAEPHATVKSRGDQLMTRYVLPLEVVGLLLTAALIGAVIIALPEKDTTPGPATDSTASPTHAPGPQPGPNGPVTGHTHSTTSELSSRRTL